MKEEHFLFLLSDTNRHDLVQHFDYVQHTRPILTFMIIYISYILHINIVAAEIELTMGSSSWPFMSPWIFHFDIELNISIHHNTAFERKIEKRTLKVIRFKVRITCEEGLLRIVTCKLKSEFFYTQEETFPHHFAPDSFKLYICRKCPQFFYIMVCVDALHYPLSPP